jgi:AcrR family transcriptional regulator
LVAGLRGAIVRRPPGEPVLEAILNALLELADVFADDPERILLHARIIAATPSLRSRGLEQQAKLEAALAGVIAERLGLDIEREMAPRLVAAGTVAALRVALDHWTERDGIDDLRSLLIDAMALLRRTFGDGVTKPLPVPDER